MRIKVRTFSGAVCEQEIYTVHDRRGLEAIKDGKDPQPRFRSDEDRERHKLLISRRRHARLVNANFSPTSFYSTLTFDDDCEVHTFAEAKKVRDAYIRRLRYHYPDAKIIIYMGRGKRTSRIHMHMLSDGLPPESIEAQWREGDVILIEPLREHNYYDGKDYGRDYTGLANYLFDHWTQEQGGHRYKATRNLRRPDRESPTECLRLYSETRPPQAPKGYKLVEAKSNSYGWLYYKYVRTDNLKPDRAPGFRRKIRHSDE